MLTEVFNFANLCKYLEIKVLNESFKLISQMADLVIENIYLCGPKIYSL